jgi:tRNA(fMet)-specific endonuclease VapC
MVALDTNSVLYVLKGKGRVAEQLLARPRNDVSVPAVVVYELEVGTLKSKSPARRRSQLWDLIGPMRVLPFGEEEAKVAARIRAQLEQAGLSIGPLDNLIAGTALRHGATLVTHNTDEFRRVPGLQIEDWY